MRPSHTLWRLTLALAACSSGPLVIDAETCDPLEEDACPTGEHCRIVDGQQPLCLRAESQPDTGCTVKSCPPKAACVIIEGQVTCRALCALPSTCDRLPADQVCVTAGPCAEGGRCAYRVTEALGVCASPCGFASGDACAPGSTCAPVPALPFPTCVAVGPQLEGQSCCVDDDERCAKLRCGVGLACLSIESDGRCRALCDLAGPDRCALPSRCIGSIANLPELGYCAVP